MKMKKVIVLVIVVLLIFVSQISLASANSYPYSVITVGNSVKSVDSTRVIVCEYVALSGKYSADIDGTIKSYRWMENGKTIDESVEIILCIKDATTRIITLEVTDNEGGIGRSEIILYANSNTEPKIEDIDTDIDNDDLRVYPCQQFEVSARIDTDDKIDVVWDYDERTFQQIGGSKVYRDKYLAEFMVLRNAVGSNSKIKISAIDTCGQEDEKEISIKVSLSKKLEIEKINVPYIEEGKRFSVSADIDTEEELKFFWTLTDLSRSRIVDTSDREISRFRLSDEGFYKMELTITNACGDSFSDFETFEIRNTQDDLPIADASLTPRSVMLHESVKFDGSKSYDDSNISYYYWFWYNKARNKYEEIYSGRSSIFYYTINQTEEHEFYLIVSDDKEPMPHQKSKPYYFKIYVRATISPPVTPAPTQMPTRCFPQNQHTPTPEIPGIGFGSVIVILIIAVTTRKNNNY